LQELKGPPSVDWDEAFQELSNYSKEHGDTKVPEKTLFGGIIEHDIYCDLNI
jgi:hypothetical protein